MDNWNTLRGGYHCKGIHSILCILSEKVLNQKTLKTRCSLPKSKYESFVSFINNKITVVILETSLLLKILV